MKLLKNPILYLGLIFFVTRLINLTILPIFNDEAIYLDWGFRQINLPKQLFFSLHDAKPPFLIWVFGLFQKLITDPLSAGRVVSVFTGFLSFMGICLTAKKLLGKSAALIASLIYILVPLFLFYDRQALMESSLSAVGIWSFYLFLKVKEEKSFKYSVLLGLLLGVGFLIKYSASVFLLGIGFLYLLDLKSEKGEAKKIYLLCCLGITFLVSQLISLILYLQSGFWSSLESNSRFVLSLSEIFSLPVGLWFTNLFTLFDISFWQFSPVLFVLAVIGIYYFSKNKSQLFYYFLFCLLTVVITTKSLQTRYLVSFLPLLCVFSAQVLILIKSKIAKAGLLFLSVLFPLSFSFMLVFSPEKYFDNLSGFTRFSQKEDYVTNWTSGFGIRETVSYLKNQSENSKIIAGVRVDAGNPESAIRAYFNASENVDPTYLDINLIGQEILNYDCLNSEVPVYFIARDANLAGLEKFFEEKERFYKPEKKRFISIHKLRQSCEGKSLEFKMN